MQAFAQGLVPSQPFSQEVVRSLRVVADELKSHQFSVHFSD